MSPRGWFIVALTLATALSLAIPGYWSAWCCRESATDGFAETLLGPEDCHPDYKPGGCYENFHQVPHVCFATAFKTYCGYRGKETLCATDTFDAQSKAIFDKWDCGWGCCDGGAPPPETKP